MSVFGDAGAGAAETPIISVLVVNYNGGGLVLRSLASVCEDPATACTELVIVDNGSSDDSPAQISARFPEARLICNPTNVGFAKAVNQAIRIARGAYFVLLNNDAFFLPGGLSRVVAFMEAHPEAGVVGPKVLNPDGTVQPSCFRFPVWQDVLFEALFLSRLFPDSDFFNRRNLGGFKHDALREVDWVSGACMAVRRSTVEIAGLLDESFFMYGEELDWCHAIRQAGQRIYYWPEPTAVHYGQQGSRRIRPETLRRGFQSRFAYFEKTHGRGYALGVRMITLVGMMWRLAFTLATATLGHRAERMQRARGYLAAISASVRACSE